MTTPSYDADMAEWKRLRHLRHLLEPLAYIFERANGDRSAYGDSECKGTCQNPKVIYQDETTGEKITCCSLLPPWERYHEVKKLERLVNAKVHLGQKPLEPARNRRVEGPLRDAYPRSHTGTYVGAKAKLLEGDTKGGAEEGEDQGGTRVPPQRHLRRS